MERRALGGGLVVALAITSAGCDDDKKERLIAQTAGEAGAIPTSSVTAPTPSATVTSTTTASASPADADAKRFDPKYKCPTGQTHFYLEGDFCRRKCLTTADCGKKERCSTMDYPFVLDGGTAGMSRFCEGT